jgi:hypothetical protein
VNPGVLAISLGRFDIYSCPRCGKIELFRHAVGREFRHVYQQGTLDETIENLDDDDPDVRLLAVKRLREFGMAPPNVSVVQRALSKAMLDQVQEVRTATCEVCNFLSSQRHLGYQLQWSE